MVLRHVGKQKYSENKKSWRLQNFYEINFINIAFIGYNLKWFFIFILFIINPQTQVNNFDTPVIIYIRLNFELWPTTTTIKNY